MRVYICWCVLATAIWLPTVVQSQVSGALPAGHLANMLPYVLLVFKSLDADISMYVNSLAMSHGVASVWYPAAERLH